MAEKRILMVFGGTYHDFEGYHAAMRPVANSAGYAVDATYDFDRLQHLEGSGTDIVLLDTCCGMKSAEKPEAGGYTEAQAESLAEWVAKGGALLAVHASTAAGRSNQTLNALMGGAFLSHPPQFSFTVYPAYREHPITAGIRAFAVHDEFYIEAYNDDVDVHMVAIDRGVVHPMVWTRCSGAGRVAHIAMGHDLGVWSLEPYQRLTVQALNWLTE